jgi:multisubunit Na+/H+ antiporter MnhF subunit
MTPWLIAALALLPPLAICVVLALRGPIAERLVAVQVGTGLGVFLLMLLAMADEQPSFLDLALALVLVSYPGTLIYTHFLERWL